MKYKIQAILFDLGDTLMYSPNPWSPIFERAGKELANALCLSGIGVDCDTFHLDFLRKLDEYYTDRDRNLIETSTIVMLEQLLSESGHTNLDEDLLRKALDKFYAITQQNWFLETDSIPMLASLKDHDFHLGLVSNAGDNRDVFTLVEKFGIEQYFDFILTSAACGFRKPHPRIFEMALMHWGLMPDEIAMVGDRLDADIGGAGPLGIYTIWIKRQTNKLISPKYPTRPDAVIENLGELLPIIFNL